MRFGLQLWSQHTDWPAFRDAARSADDGGWDSVWTWDHLLAIFGPWEQTIFEGWSVLSALGPITSRVRLGLMVGANTMRNPGLTAKLAITLDHVSGGRAVLGIGGAWFEREHDAYGIDFASGVGERLDRLDESVMLIRRLLDGERFSHVGRFYTMQDALCEPRPVQAHLPILVGGSGPKKTLRTVAERADAWNTSGTLDEVRPRLDVLAAHGADVGRDIGDDREDHQLPDHPARRPGRCRGRLRGAARQQRRRGHGARSGAAGPARHRGGRDPAVSRSRLRDGHRPDARAIRPRDHPADARSRGASPLVKVVTLAGGTGGAKLAHGLQVALGPGELTVVVNTADDTERHGLLVMPDHDSIMYMLAGVFDDERGWGLRDETWTTIGMLERYGEDAWFRLGDRDLATHIARTARIRQGRSLTDAVLDLQQALGIPSRILPMADEPVRTQVRTDEGWLEFQEYFVHRHQAPDVLEVRFDGIGAARPTAQVRRGARMPPTSSSSGPRTRSCRSGRSSPSRP